MYPPPPAVGPPPLMIRAEPVNPPAAPPLLRPLQLEGGTIRLGLSFNTRSHSRSVLRCGGGNRYEDLVTKRDYVGVTGLSKTAWNTNRILNNANFLQNFVLVQSLGSIYDGVQFHLEDAIRTNGNCVIMACYEMRKWHGNIINILLQPFDVQIWEESNRPEKRMFWFDCSLSRLPHPTERATAIAAALAYQAI